MPDLTLETRAVCETVLGFVTEVSGAKGAVYTVSFGESVSGRYSHDWTCDCASFQFGRNRGRTCKHIESVKPTRCNWNADFGDCGSHDACPQCGGDVKVLRIAV